MEFFPHHSIHPFDGEDFAYWKNIMQTYLTTSGLDVWFSVEKGYKVPKANPTNPNEIKLMISDTKTKHANFEGLQKIVQSKVISCNSTKEVWDKLKNIYEGDEKVE